MSRFTSTFLHVDMDAFFASVEQRDHPELRGKPVIVGASPDQRGVVAAASYEARAFGIHAAMPSRIAHQKCPDAIFVSSNMASYKAASRKIMTIFESFTPWVQPLSIDEAFLDVTGALRLFGSGREIAEQIRAAIFEKTQLTASVGIAPSMFLAKMASDMNKPNGITEVPFSIEGIQAFLDPLPIKRLWGVGNVTHKKLTALGLTTIQSLRLCPPHQLEQAVGARSAHHFLKLAQGIDERGISDPVAEKSISNETTFAEDVLNRSDIESAYKKLIDQVTHRLRKAGFYASTVHLKIRWNDFTSITRQTRLAISSSDEITLRETALALFNQHIQTRPIRLIGFGVSGLTTQATPDSQQLNLFESPDTTLFEKRHRLSQAADKMRDKYGIASLKRASDLQPPQEQPKGNEDPID